MHAPTGTHNHGKRLLASNELATLEACDCGVVHLHLGAMTLRLTEGSLNLLHRTLGDAVCELTLAGRSPVEALLARNLQLQSARGQA